MISRRPGRHALAFIFITVLVDMIGLGIIGVSLLFSSRLSRLGVFSVSEMLEQARKANIGLLLAHQSLSQSRGAKGGGGLADSLMVNTATKIIWTSFREDAAKFAGSMQIKADDILNLPQFTFGLHTRKRGFVPIRGRSNALSAFPKRKGLQALKAEMEARIGPSRNGADRDTPANGRDGPNTDGAAEHGPRADQAEADSHRPTDSPKASRAPKTSSQPPDVEMI